MPGVERRHPDGIVQGICNARLEFYAYPINAIGIGFRAGRRSIHNHHMVARTDVLNQEPSRIVRGGLLRVDLNEHVREWRAI